MDNQPFQLQYENQPYLAPNRNRQAQLVRRGILALASVIVLYGAYAIITALIARNNTGILQIQTTATAQVSATQASSSTKKLGQGSVKVRLKPGVYQVTASLGGTATSAIVQITKQHTTTQQLALSKAVAIKTTGNFSAQDIYPASDGSLYFVNIPQTILYNYPLGGSAGRPYLTNVNPITQAYWLSPTHFYAQVSGLWGYFDGSATRHIEYKGDGPAVNSISFNKSGEAAFTTQDKQVVLLANGEATPAVIGQTKTTNTQTSLAPNGDVLVYSPATTYGAATEATRLYRNGVFVSLPAALTGIANASWSTDSSRFSFTTNNGIFEYDLARQKTTQIFLGNPTDPLSATWISSDTLIYPNKGIIWRYQIGQNTSSELGTFAGILDTAQSFGIAADGQTVYFGTAPDSNGRGGKLYQFFPNYNELPVSEQQNLTKEQTLLGIQTPPTYNGLDGLLNIGLTSDQVNSLEYAFGTFYRSVDKSFKRLDISSIEAVAHNPNSASTTNTAYCNITFNLNDSYRARVDYTGISAVRLYVYSAATDRLLYDSGTISAAQD